MITRTRHFVCARVIKSVRVIKIIQNESLGRVAAAPAHIDLEQLAILLLRVGLED